MTTEEIKALLHQHATLRMPRIDPGDGTSYKVERLDTFLQEAAVARGNLEEARLYADHARHKLEGQWDEIQGWEMHLGVPLKKATGPQVTAAKRKASPTLYESIREAKWLVARLGDQISRIDKDEDVASRRYTLLTG